MISPGAARLNPFRSARVESLRFRSAGVSPPELLQRFESLGCRAALVGPKGSGKTTLLEALEAELESGGWSVRRWRLRIERPAPSPEEWRLVETAGERDLVTVDGAEQLSWWRWRRLLRSSRRAGALLVTCHRPCRLPTLHAHTTSPELLRNLVAELLESGGDDLPVELDELFRRHDGNIRECLRSLYDLWPRAAVP